MSKIIAICGADGAGKTTFTQQIIDMNYFDNPIVAHPVPITSKFARPDRYGRIIEILMGLEKLYSYLRKYPRHIKNGYTLIMDRCFIDAEVYALFRSIRTKDKWPIWFATHINRFAVRPTRIVFLSVNYRYARPKRNYSQADIKTLDALFWEVLMLNGYRTPGFSENYGLGTMFHFTPTDPGLDTKTRIETYYQLMHQEWAAVVEKTHAT